MHAVRGRHQLLLGGRHRSCCVLRLHNRQLHQRGVHGQQQYSVHPVPGWLVLPDNVDCDALYCGGQLLSGWGHRSGDVQRLCGRDVCLHRLHRFRRRSVHAVCRGDVLLEYL